eukprot:CAMPEP_0206620170 /NCGR_PEP_ID=MMETSP0325_2-20121206/61435_1 /ASSEMBLY_ACC=CAM_ASM_000347 /TAXON_ID=2866 /ORGANISM="Crypthecodinium cohnii, Strain Seligo" /LENGTH=164 /DNA_ID=CAMNT_0054143021 /DNA_START=131 /DNA_END=625 /DNA_ORIENTATION=+
MREKLTDDSFSVIHCRKCGTHVVITDAEIATLPRRKTDCAVVLDPKSCVIRLNTAQREGPPEIIRREKGQERQYMHDCANCKAVVGYTSQPHAENLPGILYLIPLSVKLPYKPKTYTCKVCGFICRSEVHMEAHRKARKHGEDDPASLLKAREHSDKNKAVVVG